MSYKVVAEEEVSLKKLVLVPQITEMLRAQLVESKIEEYSDKMKNGEEFPPLDVQQGTYTLLNGYHRFEAYKLACKSIVKVKVWQVADEDILFLAYRLNSKQGVPIDVNNRNRLIFEANSKGKTQKQIADIFGLSGPNISKILHSVELVKKFSNLTGNEAKVHDWRMKADKEQVFDFFEKREKKITKLKNYEIAQICKITEGRISQLYKEWSDNKQPNLMKLSGEAKQPSIGLKHLEPPPTFEGAEKENGKRPIVSFVFKNIEDANTVRAILKNERRSKVIDGEGLLTVLAHAGLITNLITSNQLIKDAQT